MGSQRARHYGGLTALLLLFPLFAFGADAEPVVIRDFSCGMVTEYDSTVINPGCSPDLLNVDVEDGSIRKRGGSVTVSTSTLGGQTGIPTRFVWEYIKSNGTSYVLSAAGSSLYYSDDEGLNNTLLTSTHGFTTSSKYCAVNAYGTARLTDGTTHWITFNGTSVGVSTSAPKGTECAFFADRVWAGNVSGDASTLYATNTDDVEDWTFNSGNADAQQIPIRYNDGDGITFLKPFRDRLLVGKRKSLDAVVVNDDGLTFTVSPVSNFIGSRWPKSVVERENDVIFLGSDGVYKYDLGSGAYRGFGGALTRISDDIKPFMANVKQLQTGTDLALLDTQADWESGTGDSGADGLATTSSAGAIVYLPEDRNTSSCGSEDPDDGHMAQSFTPNHDYILSLGSLVADSLSASTVTITMTIRSDSSNSPSSTILSTATFTPTPLATNTRYALSFSPAITVSSGTRYWVHMSSVGYSALGPVLWAWRIGGSPCLGTYSRGNAWTAASGHFTSFDFVFDVASSSSTWQSAVIDASGVSAYLRFTADANNNGGTHTYAIYSDTDTSISITNSATFTSSQTITSGSAPTLTVGNYLTLTDTFTRTVSSHTPTLNQMKVIWSTDFAYPAWATYHDGSYILCVSTASSSGNDSCLVYDRNGRWTVYDHDFYSIATLRNGKLLAGPVSTPTIVRARDSSLKDDDSTAINAYWISKEFDFGDNITDKTMLRYYLTADYSSTESFDFAYGVNRGTRTSQTLSLASVSGFFRKSVVPSSLTYQRGITHSFKVSNSDAGESFVFRSIGLKPRLETQP